MNTGCVKARLWGPILIAGLLFGWGFGAAHLHAADWTAQQSHVVEDLRDVHGAAADQVVAVGDGGVIIRYDGSAWSAMSGTETDLRGVWARPDPIAGIDAFAVGVNGRSYRYDGNSNGLWTEKATPTDQRLNGIAGTGDGILFAVGFNGALLRFDLADAASGWQTITNPAPTNAYLWDVWGCSDCSMAFAVGLFGTIIEYDGEEWRLIASPTEENLLAVWGSDETDVFAVGNKGTILHYDGVDWSQMTSGATDVLAGVWGKTATDVWAVGYNGTILYYDGNAWSPQDSGVSAYFQSVWGTPDGVFVVGTGGTVLYQGAQGPTTAAINGTATAVIAGKTVPVSGAVVSVLGSEIPSAETGEDGQYTLAGLREGTHTLQIEAPGMDPIFKDVQVVEDTTQTADLEVNPPTWIDAVVDDQVTALTAEIDRLKAEIDAMYTQEELDAAVSTALVPFDVGVQGKVGLEEAIHALEVAAGVK
jgi:hypothetical protein